MAKYIDADCRLCRREGCKLFLKGDRCLTKKCAFERRPTPPGVHGAEKSMKRPSEYSIQLREKQKVKSVATDDGRRDGTVPSASDQRTRQHIVAIQLRLRHRQVLLLRDRFIQLDSFRQQNVLRHRLTDELVQRLGAYGLQHMFFIGGGESYMAGLKKILIYHFIIYDLVIYLVI